MSQYQIIFEAEIYVIVDAENEEEARSLAYDVWIQEDVEILDITDVDLIMGEDDEQSD